MCCIPNFSLIGERVWKFCFTFNAIQDDRRYIVAETLKSDWSKESNYVLFLKIQQTNKDQCQWMHVQLWPSGGARVCEMPTWHLGRMIRGMCLKNVPKLIFHESVLWTAIDTCWGCLGPQNMEITLFKFCGFPDTPLSAYFPFSVRWLGQINLSMSIGVV